MIQRQRQIQPLPDDGYQYVHGDGDPDLGLDRVLRGAEKDFDAKMLLDPLEEQLDRPARTVEFGDGRGRQFQMVGEKDGRLALGILDADAAQRRGVTFLRIESAQGAELIADDAGGAFRGSRITALKAQVALGADDKEARGLMQGLQSFEVEIATVHDVEGARFGNQQIEDVDVVELPVADVNETRDGAPEIEQGMGLYRGLGAAERRPWKHLQAQIDRGCIERVGSIRQLDTERFVRVEPARDSDQPLSEIGVETPVAYGIGVRQGVARHGGAKTHVIELAPLGAQAGLDVAQALPVGEPRKGHAQELIEAGEALDLVMAAVALDTAMKGTQGQVSRELCKDEFAGVHRICSQWGREYPKYYGQSSNRNQPLIPNTCYNSIGYESPIGERWDTSDKTYFIFLLALDIATMSTLRPMREPSGGPTGPPLGRMVMQHEPQSARRTNEASGLAHPPSLSPSR